MTNQIEIEDIKLWMGELLLENKMLQKELGRLQAELQQIKRGLLESSPPRKEKKELETKNNG